MWYNRFVKKKIKIILLITSLIILFLATIVSIFAITDNMNRLDVLEEKVASLHTEDISLWESQIAQDKIYGDLSKINKDLLELLEGK